MRIPTAVSLALILSSCAPRPVTGPAPAPHPAEQEGKPALAWRHATRLDEHGRLPQDAVARSLQQRDALIQPGQDTAGIERGSWQLIGPGNIGGRCRSVWIHPNNPLVMVLGAVSGGFWRSESGGSTWAPVDDFPPAIAIGCMASPRGSAEIWAGTGEGMAPQGIPGWGIYRSKDAGRTWNILSSTETNAFAFVNRIAFHPTDPKTVLAGTAKGLYRSSDAGTSWTQVVGHGVTDVRFDPSDGSKCICAGRDVSGKVYHSSDAGQTWTQSVFLPSSGLRRIELAYARSNPSIVYASAERVAGQQSAVFRSVNGGAGFAIRSETGILGTQGGYGNTIWVDPKDPDFIVVGGIRMYASVDAGKTWKVCDGGAHVDHHMIVESPRYNGKSNRIVFNCSDGGIYRTQDIKSASAQGGWTSLNNDLPITQFWGGAVSAAGRAFGGTQDNGTIAVPSRVNQRGTQMYGKDGMKSDADPTDHNYLFGESQFAGVIRSTDHGVSAESIAEKVNNFPDRGAGKAPFVAPLRLDPNNPNRLWCASRRLWRTDNAKAPKADQVRWSLVRNQTDGVSAIDVAPGNSDLVVIGNRGGAVYLSRDATSSQPTWTGIHTSNLPGRTILNLRFHPRNLNHIYATFGGYSDRNVWETRDAGKNWREISGPAGRLPASPVRAFAVHPHNEGWLYVGNEVGIFASVDGGQSWATSNEGPAATSVEELVIHKDGYLYAFTWGRGIYRAHVGTYRDGQGRTVRASLGLAGQQGNGHSFDATIAAGGRVVAFASDASNLMIDLNGARDIFVRDRQAGTLSMESVSDLGVPGNAGSERPHLSEDGRYLAFDSAASNLVVGDSNGVTDIFVRDRVLGRTERVSFGPNWTQPNGACTHPSLSADARFVLYSSRASNLVSGDTNGVQDVFLYDRATQITQRLSYRNAQVPQGNGHSTCATTALSADAGYAVFTSSANNLVSGDTNGVSDVFLRSLGRSRWVRRVSLSSTGAQGNGASHSASISADGRFVAFVSSASNLVSGDSNGQQDVFLHEVATGQTTWVSKSKVRGGTGNGASWRPRLSYDGSWVLFDSIASDLLPRDNNAQVDVFLYARSSASLSILSVANDGDPATGGPSYGAALTPDAKFVAFTSGADNLINLDTNGKRDVFVTEREAAHMVFPPALTTAEGKLGTALPFGASESRVQQSALDTLGRVMSIHRLSMRRNNRPNNPAAHDARAELRLYMGACDHNALGPSFVTNWSNGFTVAIKRKAFVLPDWRSQVPGPAKFDLSLPLDTPYTHDGTAWLLWDLGVYHNTAPFNDALIDAHQGRATKRSTGKTTGQGCSTANGRFTHNLQIDSDGLRTTLGLATRSAPGNAGLALALGTRNLKLQLPGFCAPLYTDVLNLVPIGAADRNGSHKLSLPLGPWQSPWLKQRIYTQLWSVQNGQGYLSDGQETLMPDSHPGSYLRRIYAPTVLTTQGTLQEHGAVFRLDY